MKQRTVLLLILAISALALLVAAGWSARNFTKWCGDYVAWGRQVDAMTVFIRILAGAGLACLAASIVSQRRFGEHVAAIALAAIPFAAALAFVVMAWFFKYVTESGLFTGIAVTCMLDSRSLFQLIVDGLSNLWRNRRALLIGELLAAAALVSQIAWVVIARRRRE